MCITCLVLTQPDRRIKTRKKIIGSYRLKRLRSCFRLLKKNSTNPRMIFAKVFKDLKMTCTNDCQLDGLFLQYLQWRGDRGDELYSGGIFHCCLQPKTQLTKAKFSIFMLFLKLWWLCCINLFLVPFMVKHRKQEQKFCPSKELSFR